MQWWSHRPLGGRLAISPKAPSPLVLGLGHQELSDARQVKSQSLLRWGFRCPFSLYVVIQALAVRHHTDLHVLAAEVLRHLVAQHHAHHQPSEEHRRLEGVAARHGLPGKSVASTSSGTPGGTVTLSTRLWQYEACFIVISSGVQVYSQPTSVVHRKHLLQLCLQRLS